MFDLRRFFSASLISFLTAVGPVAYAGPGGYGGGNDQDGRSIPEYLQSFSKMEGAGQFDAIERKIQAELPDLAAELDRARKRVKFYVVDRMNPKLPSQVTGLYYDTDQTAIHNFNTGEVTTDLKSYGAKSPRSKLYFLTQEVIEEQLSENRPGMDSEKLHAAARALTDLFLHSGPFPDERTLQKALINEGVGYYATRSQLDAAKAAARSAPARVSFSSNVVVLKNDVPFDPQNPPPFKVGDKIRILVRAKDPQGAPIDYKVDRCPAYGGSCSSWLNGPDNTVVHTMTAEDAKIGHLIVDASVGNSLTTQAPTKIIVDNLSVSDGISRKPPEIVDTQVYFHGKRIDPSNPPPLKVGDRIRIVVNAKDPQGAPIHYKVEHCPAYGGSCNSWLDGPDNTVVHTLTEKDAKTGPLVVDATVGNSLTTQAPTKIIVDNLSVSDGISRKPPVIVSTTTEKEGLRKLTKQEALDLRDYLEAHDPDSCSAVLGSLNDFLRDSDSTRMDILVWSTRKIDQATRVCLNVVQAALGQVLVTDTLGEKSAPTRPIVADPTMPRARSILD